MLSSEIPKVPTEPQVRGFPAVWKFSSFMTPSPGQFSVPNSFISLLVFYILPYLLSKRMGCLSGCLVSSASIQKLFCGSCSAFRWSFLFVCSSLLNCGGESGLPVLFLHHLRTAGQWYFLLNPYILKVCVYFYHTQTMICFLTNLLSDHFFLHVLIFFKSTIGIYYFSRIPLSSLIFFSHRQPAISI